MNLIECLTVIRFSCSEKFIEELDNNDIGCAFAKTAFVSKLFSGKSNFRSRD